MAQFGDDLGPSKGTLDNVTFYMRNGKKIARRKHRTVSSTERSITKMSHCSQWGNVVNAWKLLRPISRPLFEMTDIKRTAYNRFMSLNTTGQGVSLTKSEAALGTCVVDGFWVSDGGYTPLEVRLEGDKVVSGIPMGTFNVTPESTVGEFTAAVIWNGKYPLTDGNELIFIQMKQHLSGDTLLAQASQWSLRLSLHDHRPLLTVLGLDGPGQGLLNEQGFLSASLGDEAMGTWVVKHTDSYGRILISPQRLVGNNRWVEAYCSGNQRKKAAKSYGAKKEQDFFSENYDGPGVQSFFRYEESEEDDVGIYVVGRCIIYITPAKAARVLPQDETNWAFGQQADYPIRLAVNKGYTFMGWDDSSDYDEVLTRPIDTTRLNYLTAFFEKE